MLVARDKVNLDLVGENGNAFYVMGLFRQKAKDEGWTDEEVDVVLAEAKNGDYDHLLMTITEHCTDDQGQDREEY